jgi:hypothetical protein
MAAVHRRPLAHAPTTQSATRSVLIHLLPALFILTSIVQVIFNGQHFNVIQAHESQGDWLPPQVPALYGPGAHGSSHGQPQHHGGPPPQGYPQGGPPQGYPQGGPPQGYPQGGPPGYGQQQHPMGTPGGTPGGQHHGTPQDEKHGIFNFLDHNNGHDEDQDHNKGKLALEIGGGLCVLSPPVLLCTAAHTRRCQRPRRARWRRYLCVHEAQVRGK